MKRILATTALAALTAMPVYAETNGAAMSAPEISVGADALSAETLIGKRIYIDSGEGDTGFSLTDLTDAPDSWTDVGEVGDVIIGKDGKVESVIADIGGFLGVGEREVALQMDSIEFAPDRDDEGEYFVVYQGERATLEEATAFQMGDAGDDSWLLSTDNDGMNDGMAETAQDGAMDGTMTEPTEMAQTDQPDTALSPEERTALTAEELEGQSVHDSSGKRIGEVSDLVLTDDGSVDKVVIDVGGFLGIGEKPVALPFGDIRIARTGDDAFRLTTNHTQNDLEQMTRWES